MRIKNISVKTLKNHIETEVFFDEASFIKDCYLEQGVFPSDDDENCSCSMVAGIPGLRVLTCADALPAIPSTRENPFHYNLRTKVYSSDGSLLDENSTVFEFKLPDRGSSGSKGSFFSRFFSRKY